MRVRSALFALVAVGCTVDNPDPRHPTLVQMQTEGHGGWIVVTTTGGSLDGELISVEPDEIRVLNDELRFVPTRNIVKAELYAYEAESFGTFEALGTISALSHGFLAIVSVPVWLVADGVINGVESSHAIHDFPREDWSAFAPWARFPQGMPAGLKRQDLIAQPRHEPVK